MLQIILGDKNFGQFIGKDTYIGTPTYAWFEENCLSTGISWLNDEFSLKILKVFDDIDHMEDSLVPVRSDGTALALSELSGNTLALLTLYYDPILDGGHILMDINFSEGNKGIALVEELASHRDIKICTYKSHRWEFKGISEISILNYGEQNTPALIHNLQELLPIYKAYELDRSSGFNKFKHLPPVSKVRGHLIVTDHSHKSIFNIGLVAGVNIITNTTYESKYLEQILKDSQKELSSPHKWYNKEFSGKLTSPKGHTTPYWHIEGRAGSKTVEVYYFKDTVYQTTKKSYHPHSHNTKLPPSGSIIIISEEVSKYLPVQGKRLERFIGRIYRAGYYLLIYSSDLAYFWPKVTEICTLQAPKAYNMPCNTPQSKPQRGKTKC